MSSRFALFAAVAGALCAVGYVGCTDAGLYQWKRDPFQANKLTVSGTVCTDDPRQRNFPVKVLFIVDSSLAISDTANDSTGYRGKAVQKVITDLGKNPNYYFGIIAYAGKARSLIDEGFTQDSTKLTAATGSLQGGAGIGGAGGCFGPRCRDLRAAMSVASSVVTGDILAADPGANSRTSYVIILFAGGPPVPAIGRCACRDLKTEGDADKWPTSTGLNCAWSECDGCKVTCPPNTKCQDTLCLPICTPSCDQQDEFCDANFTCQMGTAPPGGISLPPVSNTPVTTPDTFNVWVPSVTNTLDPTKIRPLVAGDPLDCAHAACVYYPNGGGHADSCEERVLVQAVRELKQFALSNGTASLQLHAGYLPDAVDYSSNPTSQFAPLCDAASDQARTVQLLTQMAFTGDGGFTQFPQASAIQFDQVELFRSRAPLVIKELVVTNINVIAAQGGILVDSDADGLTDVDEKKLGLCPSDPDTDGDGISDAIEVKLATDPLKADDPIECVDIKKETETVDDLCNPGQQKTKTVYVTADGKRDGDGDGFNPCEERLLGTIDTLIDSDADGIPDKVEFVAGTNYLAVDPLQDIDFDGQVNRDELRAHTDARSNDTQQALDLAYRYDESDEGIKTVLSFTQPPTITGVEIKNVSSKSTPGLGQIKFDPGGQPCSSGDTCPSGVTCGSDGACPPTLAWKDFADNGPGGDFGPAVDISKPNSEGFRLESCMHDSSGACSPDSAERFITVLVQGPQSYPPKQSFDRITISSALRNCLRFSVKNITLLETLAEPDLNDPGTNTVLVYFAEAPQGQKDAYGIFRVASTRLNYKKGPPETRTPRVAEIVFTDDDFKLFQ